MDFFPGGMSLGSILLWTVRDGLIVPAKQGGELISAGESLQEIVAKIDPAAIEEAVGGYGALNGVRLHKAFSMLGAPRTVGSLWILAICLGGVRFFAKYLRASVRSSRIKQHRATGVKPRPPVLDLIHEEWSPVVVVLQFLSSVIANGPGGFGQGPLTLHKILWTYCAEGGRRGSVSAATFEENLRVGVVSTAVAMYWRHVRRFRQMEYLVGATVDSDQSLGFRREVQRNFFGKPDCCVGFTAADLRTRVTRKDVASQGCWKPFAHQAIYSIMDTMDLNTNSTESKHASHQKLCTEQGGGAGYITLCAKSINREASSQADLAADRNLATSGPRGPKSRKRKASSLGQNDNVGLKAGYHMLHGEVCRELALPASSRHAHRETRQRWDKLTAGAKNMYRTWASSRRSQIQADRSVPVPALPAPLALHCAAPVLAICDGGAANADGDGSGAPPAPTCVVSYFQTPSDVGGDANAGMVQIGAVARRGAVCEGDAAAPVSRRRGANALATQGASVARMLSTLEENY